MTDKEVGIAIEAKAREAYMSFNEEEEYNEVKAQKEEIESILTKEITALSQIEVEEGLSNTFKAQARELRASIKRIDKISVLESQSFGKFFNSRELEGRARSTTEEEFLASVQRTHALLKFPEEKLRSFYEIANEMELAVVKSLHKEFKRLVHLAHENSLEEFLYLMEDNSEDRVQTFNKSELEAFHQEISILFVEDPRF